MKSRRSSQQHIIDILFPLALLLVFLLSAMMVLLLASDLYGRITTHSTKTNDARIAAAYLTEKLHQNDAAGCVRVDRLEGTDALVLDSPDQGADYCTYIYCYDGALRELMIKQDLTPSPDRGRKILSLSDFQVRQLSGQLYCFTCADREDNTSDVYVTVRSVED